ncbi:MAG: hypothetical protein ACTSUE_06285 [Promethearchaeota archaeon]
MSDEEKTEVKDSNELLNLFLIIIGAIFIFQGIVNYVSAYFPAAFDWLPQIIKDTLNGTGDASDTFRNLMGQNALQQTVMGTFCFIAGVGMFKEQEWAWGMSIILLSLIIITTAGSLIGKFMAWDASYLTYWPFWIEVISVAFATLGILWLLGTKERYS